MIAIPVDTDQEKNPTLSTKFGNAPYFALYNSADKSTKIIPNEGCGNGFKTAQFLIDLKIHQTLYRHMGQGLFERLHDAGVAVYCVKEICELTSLLEKFHRNVYPKLTSKNASTLLDSGNAQGVCECGCEV